MDFPKHRNRLLQSEFFPSGTETHMRGGGGGCGRVEGREGEREKAHSTCQGWRAPFLPSAPFPPTHTQMSSPSTVPGVGRTHNHGLHSLPRGPGKAFISIHSGAFVLPSRDWLCI